MNKYVIYIIAPFACSCGLLAHGAAQIWTDLNTLLTQAQTEASLANTQNIRNRCIALHMQLQELRNRVNAHKTSQRSRAILDELLARTQKELNFASAGAYALSQEPVHDTGLWGRFSRAAGLSADVDTAAYDQIVRNISNTQSKFAQIAAIIEQAGIDMAPQEPTFVQKCKNVALHLTRNTHKPAINCHQAGDSVLSIGLHAALTDPQERSQDLFAFFANSISRAQALATSAAAQAMTATASLAQGAHKISTKLATASDTSNLQLTSWMILGADYARQLSQSPSWFESTAGEFLMENVVSNVIDPAHISWFDKWINPTLEYVTGYRMDGLLDAYSQLPLANRVHACATWLQEKTAATACKLSGVAAKIRSAANNMQAKSHTCVQDITHEFAAINIEHHASEHEQICRLICGR